MANDLISVTHKHECCVHNVLVLKSSRTKNTKVTGAKTGIQYVKLRLRLKVCYNFAQKLNHV